MGSWVWRWFSKKTADGVTKDQCGKCGKMLSYSRGSTKNMSDHLRSIHSVTESTPSPHSELRSAIWPYLVTYWIYTLFYVSLKICCCVLMVSAWTLISTLFCAQWQQFCKKKHAYRYPRKSPKNRGSPNTDFCPRFRGPVPRSCENRGPRSPKFPDGSPPRQL